MFIDRYVGHQRDLAVDDALAQVARLDFGSKHRPVLMPYTPTSHGNPFQALTYSSLPSRNLRAVPAYTMTNAAAITQALQGGPEVLIHLHWLNVVMQSADGTARARHLLEAFVDQLHQVKADGASLMWTVHNVMPHDARYPDLELELRQRVVELVDLVHVMSPRTRALVSPLFTLPTDRTFQVPHPSYAGVYPQWMSRSQARAELGLPEHAVVFALFGRIAPYKGVTELVAAFDRFSADRPGEVHLVLAGKPQRDGETQALLDAVTAHPAIHGRFTAITDDKLQVFLAAADVMALPYRKSLNSGALNLALTFGLPVVLPRSSGEVGSADAAWAEIYDDDAPDGLYDALHRAAGRLATPEAGQAAREAAERVPPAMVSAAFADVVRHWVDHGSLPEERLA
jgi:glycosyltransferase involved in cell wall biosynthesis